MAEARLGAIALDCDDPAALADFWAALLGGEVAYRSPTFCALRTDRGWLSTVKVDDHRPPTWPRPEIPKQMHLDVAVGDLDAVEAEARRLGARILEDQPAPDRWRVLADPAGHPFCLSTQIPA